MASLAATRLNPILATGTILIYDLLCTLDLEIDYVWSKPWSSSSVIFFLNRYSPFIDTFMSINLQLAVDNSPEKCLTHVRVTSWFLLFGIILAEMILMLRTYAIWERKRSIGIGFIVMSVCAFVPSIVITYLELSTMRFTRAKPGTPGCALLHASPIIIIAYILLVLSETAIAVLLAIKAVQHLRQSQSPWVVQIYRNGLLFYILLVALSFANIIITICVPKLANWLATPQRGFHSIVCNRILLHIFRKHDPTDRSPVLTSIVDETVTMTRMEILELTYYQPEAEVPRIRSRRIGDLRDNPYHY